MAEILTDQHKQAISSGRKRQYAEKKAGTYVKPSLPPNKKKYVRVEVEVPEWIRQARMAKDFERKINEIVADAEVDAASYCRGLKSGGTK